MFKNPDLLLLHAPSVYDFRRRPVLFGPVADVVPSTTAFEMYPLGLANIAEHLQRTGKSVRIFNLAYRMLADPDFDAERAVASFRPRLFGIDLHWLVHAHGAVEVARLCKKHHPEIPVVLGGLSASYFHEELVRRPEVDYVLRGDSTEEAVEALLDALARGEGFADVPGLTWTDRFGGLHANPMALPPSSLDRARDPYLALFRMTTRYLDAKSLTAIHDWWRHPQMAVLTFRGCNRTCNFCGGSHYTFRRFFGRDRCAFRPPDLVARDVLNLARYSNAPIFLLGDPREAGDDYAEELFRRLGSRGLKNQVVVELYRPAPEGFFDLLAENLASFNIEISPESHDEEIRRACGKPYANDALLDNIRWALDRGCGRFDLFFMIGLPRQDRASVLATVDWATELMGRFDARLVPFTSALSPFLDPGCPAFENPERHGYTLLRRSFEEHRRALEEPSWEFILNYETRWMTRRDIVEVTYEAGRKLNRAKRDAGRVTPEQFERVDRNGADSAALADEIRRIVETTEGEEREALLAALRPRMSALSQSVICAKEEFRWPGEGFHYLAIARAVLTGWAGQLS